MQTRIGGKVVSIKAKLVIAADGCDSTLCDTAGLSSKEFGAPMDVMWFRMPRGESDPRDTFGGFDAGQIFIRIDRGALATHIRDPQGNRGGHPRVRYSDIVEGCRAQDSAFDRSGGEDPWLGQCKITDCTG